MPQEVDELFGNLAELKREGLTVIFISHKLDEVRKVRRLHHRHPPRHHRRRGRPEDDDRAPAGRDDGRLRAALAGDPDLHRPRRAVVLELRGRDRGDAGRAAGWSTTSSLTVREGEVVGIAGVEGNGQAELVDAIMGLRPLAAGSDPAAAARTIVRLEHPRTRGAEAGIGFIPEDRHRQGMLLEAPLWENRILGHQTRPPAAKGLFIDRKAARADTERIMREYDVRAPGPDTLAVALSGGNQQKLIVGPRDELQPAAADRGPPTRGVDVGAQAAIWELLKDARAEGMGDPADLRRPRRADRAVGHAARHAARPAGGHARPGARARPSSSAAT